MPRDPGRHRKKGAQCTGEPTEEDGGPRALDGKGSSPSAEMREGHGRRNRMWTEDEEVRLAALLLRHGPLWSRVAAGLEGRTANTVRCKVRNDIRVAQTTYRNKQKEYSRLLFRVAYRMEERGARLEQLGPADFAAELSPADHPRIYAEYCEAAAKAGGPLQAAREGPAEDSPSPSPPLWWSDYGDYQPLAWITARQSGFSGQQYGEHAHGLMLPMGHWESESSEALC